MKYFYLFILIVLLGCHSGDGTSRSENETVEEILPLECERKIALNHANYFLRNYQEVYQNRPTKFLAWSDNRYLSLLRKTDSLTALIDNEIYNYLFDTTTRRKVLNNVTERAKNICERGERKALTFAKVADKGSAMHFWQTKKKSSSFGKWLYGTAMWDTIVKTRKVNETWLKMINKNEYPCNSGLSFHFRKRGVEICYSSFQRYYRENIEIEYAISVQDRKLKYNLLERDSLKKEYDKKNVVYNNVIEQLRIKSTELSSLYKDRDNAKSKVEKYEKEKKKARNYKKKSPFDMNPWFNPLRGLWLDQARKLLSRINTGIEQKNTEISDLNVDEASQVEPLKSKKAAADRAEIVLKANINALDSMTAKSNYIKERLMTDTVKVHMSSGYTCRMITDISNSLLDTCLESLPTFTNLVNYQVANNQFWMVSSSLAGEIRLKKVEVDEKDYIFKIDKNPNEVIINPSFEFIDDDIFLIVNMYNYINGTNRIVLLKSDKNVLPWKKTFEEFEEIIDITESLRFTGEMNSKKFALNCQYLKDAVLLFSTINLEEIELSRELYKLNLSLDPVEVDLLIEDSQMRMDNEGFFSLPFRDININRFENGPSSVWFTPFNDQDVKMRFHVSTNDEYYWHNLAYPNGEILNK